MRYMVSVFVDGKCVDSHYSESLTELVTIKVVYAGCQIDILDLKEYKMLTPQEVNELLNESRECWRQTMIVKSESEKRDTKVVKRGRPVKERVWERRVLCVETGQSFKSIREASDMTGIPYMTIANCIKNGNATRGVHFVNEKREV